MSYSVLPVSEGYAVFLLLHTDLHAWLGKAVDTQLSVLLRS